MQLKQKSPALAALTASALAIPGAQAASPPNGLQADYQFHAYREQDLDAGQAAGPVRSRYSIDSHLFRLVGAPSDRVGVSLDFAFETMSGASPWFITPGANGPVQVMSGASIAEKRSDVLVRADLHGDERKTGVQIGASVEDDYKSVNLGIDHSLELNQSNTIVSGGLGVSVDELEPTDGGSARFPNRIVSASKDSTTAFASIEQTLSTRTALQIAVNYTDQDGYLSDPYKLAYVGGTTVPDTRPDRRQQLGLVARLRHYFQGMKAALHADYRSYGDDWDVRSDTVELAWHQSLPGTLRVAPAVRWYSQTQADFYAPYYNQPTSDGLYSSDYRLSPYGALSLSLNAVKEIDRWRVSLRYEHYDSAADYALGRVDVENPGLVDFEVFSATVRRTF